MGMHHAENNMPEDTSSTMSYQRDSLGGFLQYLGDFISVGIFRLLAYFDRKKKKKFYFKSVRGEVAFFAWCIVLSFVNFPATFADFFGVGFLMLSSMPTAEKTSTSFAGIKRSRNSRAKINKNPNKSPSGKIQTAMRLRALGERFWVEKICPELRRLIGI